MLTIDTISVDQPPQLIVQEIVTQAVGEQQGSITLIASGGTPPYQYSVDNGVNLQDTNYFGNLDAGIYDAYVIDDRGCIYADTVNVSAKLLLVDILDYKDASCYGFSDGGFTVLILNGTQPYNVLITDTVSGETVRDVTGYNQDIFADENFEAGSYNVRITDAQSQVFDSVFIITQPSQIIPDITQVNTSCEEFTNDGSIQVTPSGGAGNYAYQWSDDVTNTDSIRTSLAAGNYYLTVTDGNGCPVTTEVIVGFDHAAVYAWAGEDTTICAYSQYQLQGMAAGPDSIRWNFDPDDLVSASDESIYITDPASLNSLMSTNRTVSLLLRAYQGGCYGLDTVTIDVFPVYDMILYESEDPPITELDTLIYLSEGETRQFRALLSDGLTPFPASAYSWIPENGLQIDSLGYGTIMQVADSITYSITGTSVNGCPRVVSLPVVLLSEVKIYSGFTPNDDGYNDTWIIENAEGYGSKIEVKIFNRWGELIFQSTGYDGAKAWDGTFKGKPLPIGTYYYIIDIKDGKTNPITGAVTLIR
jgi:gliding motility-associated-like protein